MIKMTTKHAVVLAPELGLTISMCTPGPDGWEMGRLCGSKVPDGREPDLRTEPISQAEVWIEALTPDGQAFLELVAEAA